MKTKNERLYHHQSGMTLLEVLLVVAIGLSIVILSLSAYQSLLQSKNFQQLQENVDELFLGMSNFYYANCTSDATLITAATTPYSISLTTLNNFLPNWQSYNPLIASQGQDITTATPSYVTQFNPITTSTGMNVTACVVLTNGTACTPQTGTVATSVESIIAWVEQVAIRMPSTSVAGSYLAQSGATCTSSLVGGTPPYVTPCSSTSSGQYLVWQRSPSLARSQANSNFWPTMPLVKQFTMQYTHDQMYELSGQSSPSNSAYLCGG